MRRLSIVQVDALENVPRHRDQSKLHVAQEQNFGVRIETLPTNDQGAVIGGQEAIHIYRILQETLNNVARHSKSSEAWVRLIVNSGRLRLEVEDRGVGMSEAGAGGLGLIAMRERADILQGKLDLIRPPEGGTLVILEAPLAQAATA